MDSNELYELNFIVIDHRGGTVEGGIPANKIVLFKNMIKEGLVHVIQCFNIFTA